MIEYLPLVLTGFGLTASIIYYASVLKNANKTRELQLKAQEHATETRQAQLFMQLFDRWSEPEFAKQYGEYRYKICAQANNDPNEICKIAVNALFESYNPEVWVPIQTLTQYFEGISILVQKELIDVDIVERLLSNRILWYWEATQPFIEYVRERVNDPLMYQDLEILATEMKKRKSQPDQV